MGLKSREQIIAEIKAEGNTPSVYTITSKVLAQPEIKSMSKAEREKYLNGFGLSQEKSVVEKLGTGLAVGVAAVATLGVAAAAAPAIFGNSAGAGAGSGSVAADVGAAATGGTGVVGVAAGALPAVGKEAGKVDLAGLAKQIGKAAVDGGASAAFDVLEKTSTGSNFLDDLKSAVFGKGTTGGTVEASSNFGGDLVMKAGIGLVALWVLSRLFSSPER